MTIRVYDHFIVFKKPKTQKDKTAAFPNIASVVVDGRHDFDVSIGDTLQLNHVAEVSLWTILKAFFTGKEVTINQEHKPNTK